MKPGFSDMFRRKFLFGCALAPAGFAAAQQNVSTAPRRPKIPVDPDQGGPVYWSGDDLKKLHATLAAKGAANNQTAPSPVGMLELPVTHTHLFNFVHRYPVPNREPVVEFHDGVTDVYFMVAGSGTMRIGGELQGRRQIPNMPGEYQGSAIEGGREYKVKAGDVVNIPPSTAHQTRPDPGGLSYMLLKVNIGMYPWAMIASQQSLTEPHLDVPLAPDQGGIIHWPAEDLQKAHTTLAAAAANGQTKPGPRDIVNLPITHTHLYNFLCRYPSSREPRAEYHEGVTDVYFIVAGGATMVIGGELDNPVMTRPPGEYQGGIKNGRSYQVKPFDIINIPPNTAHLTHPEPGGFSYMLVKVNVGMYPWTIVAKQQAV